jgi:hypothetical protein
VRSLFPPALVGTRRSPPLPADEAVSTAPFIERDDGTFLMDSVEIALYVLRLLPSSSCYLTPVSAQ